MNKNWIRWIHSSLNTYVKEELKKLGIDVYFEPLDRTKLASLQDHVEFRWNGPVAKEHSRNYWFFDVALNFVISSTTNRKDTYKHKEFVGKVQSILKQSISVFKYGNGEEDDQTLLSCLQLRVDKDGIETNYFGRTDALVEIEESTVEATYYMNLRV